MSMDHVRAAVDRVVPLVNRTRSLNTRPFDAETPVGPPSGRGRSWVHYGVMVPDLPDPHRSFGVMSIVGTPGVALFANDQAIATTPRDTVYTVSATAAMTSRQFFVQSMAEDCDFRDDGSHLRFGSDLTMSGSYPNYSVQRTHPDASVTLSITATDVVSHFANVPGLYAHWSILARCTGHIDDASGRTEIAGLCTVEHAAGVGVHSLTSSTRWRLPALFFTYHVLNIDDTTQVLLVKALGPADVVVQEAVYIRSVDEHGSAHTVGVDFDVTAYEPEARRTPTGRLMRLPATMTWSLTDPATGERIISIDTATVTDLTYGLGAGYVGNYRYHGTFHGEPITGSAYLEYIDCRDHLTAAGA
ncbi:DUF6670 family protein [Rhodococcus sp. MEB064]|uniref:DUF6670 family protein n=1 Tax=Rhodococcus sp. MEB064 TaxID=1587522 RepID=UPI0005AD15B2